MITSQTEYFVFNSLSRGCWDCTGVAVMLDRPHPPVVREGESDVVPHGVRHKVDGILLVAWLRIICRIITIKVFADQLL